MQHENFAIVDGTRVTVSELNPTARQVLIEAGYNPEAGYRLFRIAQGAVNSLALDAHACLCEDSSVKFRVFNGAEIYSFELDNKLCQWGASEVSGLTLKEIANVDPQVYGVWLAMDNTVDDPLIGDDEFFELSCECTSRFFTGIKSSTEGRVTQVLPQSCRNELDRRNLCFEEHEESGQKAIIIKSFPLPVGHFDVSSADVLVLLPSGYPDCPPDMFFTSPWLRISSSNQFPKSADQCHGFLGINWQRWSRHNNEWRPNIDGIRTVILRINAAFECAT